MTEYETPQSQFPEPDPDAALEPLIIDASEKEWFVTLLTELGFGPIAEGIQADQTELWFTRMFVGLVQSLNVMMGQLQQLQVMMAGGAPAQQAAQEGVIIAEQDHRIVLPGDPEFTGL